MKISLMLAILFYLGIISAYGKTENGRIILHGIPLFSFNPNSITLQTDQFTYQFSKALLNENEIKSMEEAIVQNRPVEISLPNSSIEYFWPTKIENAENSEKQKTVAEIKEVVNFHRDEIEINGRSILSLSDPFFLIRSGEIILQIKKSELDPVQKKILADSMPGSSVNITMPNRALDHIWNYGQKIAPSIPSKYFVEKFSLKNGMIHISGTMLLSQEEPLILMQSNGLIFQLRKSSVKTRNRSLLDSPGSQVRLRAPYKAIANVWPTQSNEKQVGINGVLKMNMIRLW